MKLCNIESHVWPISQSIKHFPLDLSKSDTYLLKRDFISIEADLEDTGLDPI